MEHRTERIFQPCTKYPEGKITVEVRASKIDILIFHHDERWNAPSDPVQTPLGIHVNNVFFVPMLPYAAHLCKICLQNDHIDIPHGIYILYHITLHYII